MAGRGGIRLAIPPLIPGSWPLPEPTETVTVLADQRFCRKSWPRLAASRGGRLPGSPLGAAARSLAARAPEVAGGPEAAGGYQVTFGLTFEREGQEKPVCVAELLFRYYGLAS